MIEGSCFYREGELRNFDDSIDHAGAKKVRGGRPHLFGSSILIELDVVKDEAKILLPKQRIIRLREIAFRFEEFKANRKLSAPEVGLLKYLALASPALEHIEMLSDGFRLGRWSVALLHAGIENEDMSPDKISDIFEEERCALLPILSGAA